MGADQWHGDSMTHSIWPVHDWMPRMSDGLANERPDATNELRDGLRDDLRDDLSDDLMTRSPATGDSRRRRAARSPR